MIADLRLWCWGTRLRAAAAGKGTVCLTRGREEGEGQLAAHRAADQSVREQSRERLTDSLILSSSPHLYYATHQLSSVLLHVFFTFSSPIPFPLLFRSVHATSNHIAVSLQQSYCQRKHMESGRAWPLNSNYYWIALKFCSFLSKVQLSTCILFTSIVLQSKPCTQMMSRKEL